MTHEPKVISGPVKEPVTVAETTLHTRADYANDDTLYDIWIGAARDYVETQAGITVHEKTLEHAIDRTPDCNYIVLPRATPLIAVTSVTFYDVDETPTVMPAADYIADTYGQPGRIVLSDGASWPLTTLRPVNGIVIRYRCGIATASPEAETPAKIKHPVLLLVNSMDRNRSAETVPDRKELGMISLQYGVEAFISRLRVEPTSY